MKFTLILPLVNLALATRMTEVTKRDSETLPPNDEGFSGGFCIPVPGQDWQSARNEGFGLGTKSIDNFIKKAAARNEVQYFTMQPRTCSMLICIEGAYIELCSDRDDVFDIRAQTVEDMLYYITDRGCGNGWPDNQAGGQLFNVDNWNIVARYDSSCDGGVERYNFGLTTPDVYAGR